LTTVVVDSSVALKWFVPEIHSDRAASLLEGSVQMTAPDLLFPEAGNILWKKVTRGELSPEEARDVIAALKRIPIAVASSSSLLEGALEIAIAHERTVYDSLYVALAVARNCPFVTADVRLANALANGPLAEHVKKLSTYSNAP
jgi:predicted nucleic acid-binding protein